MAKRRRRGWRGFGSLGQAGSMAREVVPPVLGVLAAGGATIAIRAFVRPDTEPKQKAFRYAPWIGLGTALLGAGITYAMGGQRPATTTALAGVLTAATIAGNDMLVAARPEAYAALMPSAAEPAAAGTAGLRALVAERSRGSGMNGIVMEPTRGRGMGNSFGEAVNLQGTANPSAFGRPQSRMG